MKDGKCGLKFKFMALFMEGKKNPALTNILKSKLHHLKDHPPKTFSHYYA